MDQRPVADLPDCTCTGGERRKPAVGAAGSRRQEFPVGSRYGRKAPESCRSRYWQMRQELPSIYLFPFGVEACFL